MIQKIKDLSKVSINAQDVMLLVTVETKKANGLNLDLSAMNKQDLDELEKIISVEVITSGVEASIFKKGQIVSMKNNSQLGAYDSLTEDTTKRVVVVNMVSIAYGVNMDNYEK